MQQSPALCANSMSKRVVICLRKRAAVLLFSLIPFFTQAQSFFGVASTPADNGANAGATVTITPPGSMAAGDLAIVYLQYKGTPTQSLTLTNAGGQTWYQEISGSSGTTNISIALFWCRFNGTWATNPIFTAPSTNAFSGLMTVFRPNSSSDLWDLDVAASSTSNGSSTTQTINGITTLAPKTVTMAYWSCAAGNTYSSLSGSGWSNTGLSAQYRNTTGPQASSAAYNIQTSAGVTLNNVSQKQSASSTNYTTIIAWREVSAANDVCGSPVSLTSASSCNKTWGTLSTSTYTAIGGIAASCGTALSPDVWFTFTAQTAYPTITVANPGSSLSSAGVRLYLYSGNCSGLTELACSSTSSINVKTAGVNSGKGLASGTTYYVRVTKNSATLPTGPYWGFSICITDPSSTGKFDYSKSYINVTNQTTGGTMNPGDVLEFRATMAISGQVDSLAFEDTVFAGGGLILNNGSGGDSICTRTNEGVVYKYFTDAAADDAGYRSKTASGDTIVHINIGTNATSSARGKLYNTSRPSFYNSTCIIMATYRVKISASYNTSVRWGGGKISYRDTATGNITTIVFPTDSFYVYSSPGLCPNSVATNAIGGESNGTFDSVSRAASAPITRNRAASSNAPSYTYAYFQSASAQGPQDYYYGVVNNSSTKFTKVDTVGKPDNNSTTYRLFGLWDIIGDHTNASNTALGNPPCDTTQAASASNPCGYALFVNSSYKTDTAFQYTVSGLCSNTYYQISAWVRNICKYCSCDSAGNGVFSGSYLHYRPDSSGVQPNVTFRIGSKDYYNSGDIYYYNTGLGKGANGRGTDSSNKWVQKGFTYLTGANETSFTFTMRNNAPGGGGNDWALDDVGIATCYPSLKYSPSNNPLICYLNPYTIYDTVSSYFNNYTYYKWQISQNGGVTWTDVAGASGVGSPTWNGSAWVYVASYTIPATMTWSTNNGDQYRLVVATNSSNLSSASCNFTDTGVITITTWNCPWALDLDLLSFSGKQENDHNVLFWTTSKEKEPLDYIIEKSSDGINFTQAGTVTGYDNGAEKNYYTFTDPGQADKTYWYRIRIVNKSNQKKYSGVIKLSTEQQDFLLGNVINPFRKDLTFEVSTSRNANIKVSLTDMFGRPIRTSNYTVYAGANMLNMANTEGLSAGTYILSITNGEISLKKTVVKY